MLLKHPQIPAKLWIIYAITVVYTVYSTWEAFVPTEYSDYNKRSYTIDRRVN